MSGHGGGLGRWWAGWRSALRMARREALRARGRSVLVLVMIALPVLGVTAADVLIQTQDVNGHESLDRRLGSADARVRLQRGMGRVVQWADPDTGSFASGRVRGETPDAAGIAAALGGARLVELRNGTASARTDQGSAEIEVVEVDLRDPVAAGLFRLTDGRWPAADDEVVVNAALAAKGYALGDRLVTPSEQRADPVIVGLAESTTVRDFPLAAGPVGSLRPRTWGTRTWLIDADGPVTWSQVRALNSMGAEVLSRYVVEHPPPKPPELDRAFGSGDSSVVVVGVLVVVMALIEVVLLAGPAFAVGARRQSRSLALLAATGGTPQQSRRVVLAGAVVLGGAASMLGVALGIGVAGLFVPVLQAYSGEWLGPFDVPWLHLVGVAGFGLVSAFLAAVVPAWIASRQDVVAVLTGRRGEGRASLRSPALGVLLLGAGIAAAAYGASSPASGHAEYLIAGAAILSVLGMLLLVPIVLVLVGRLARRLPLALRYAARDAARHRARTVPAVAAVAATVAGVVALGIATASDEAQNEGHYDPSLVAGTGVVRAGINEEADWPAMRRVVKRDVPGARVREIRGLWTPRNGYVEPQLLQHGETLLWARGATFGSEVLVSDGELPAGLVGVTAAARREAERSLAAGGLVAFTDHGGTDGPVELRLVTRDNRGRPTGPPLRASLSATVVPVREVETGPAAVISTELANRLDLRVVPVGLEVTGADISEVEQQAATEGLAALEGDASFYVERGYVPDEEALIVEAVLFGLGALLMLGGTLTATFLALSDARPDLATLAAVGAAPRTRRGVAASYALSVGLVGAVLGVLVGFIPGLAVTYPLTGADWGPMGVTTGPSHYVDVPWLLVLGLLVVLPLLTAAIVSLCVRSRLPLVARLD